MRVNRTRLADIIGKTEKTIGEWVKEGMPRISTGGHGVESEYDTAEVIRWMIARESGGNAIGADGQIINYDAERARLTKEQADKVAMENDLRRGALADTERVAALWANVLTNVKNRMLAIPTRAAPLVMGRKSLPEVRDTLRRLIVEGLTELADTDPTADASGTGGADASAGLNGEPMGGRPPEVKRRKQRGAGPVGD